MAPSVCVGCTKLPTTDAGKVIVVTDPLDGCVTINCTSVLEKVGAVKVNVQGVAVVSVAVFVPDVAKLAVAVAPTVPSAFVLVPIDVVCNAPVNVLDHVKSPRRSVVELAVPVPWSAATSDLKVGVAAPPDDGPEKIKFAF